MKINQIILNEMGTVAGAVATVAKPMGETQKRPMIRGLEPVSKVMTDKAKKKGPYQNSLSEAKKDFAAKIAGKINKANKDKKETDEKVKQHQQDQKKNKVDEAKLDEDDIILVPGQGMKRKTGFVPHGQSRVDHEVEMARSDVLATMKNAKAIYQLLKDRSEDQGIEGWVQEKLIKANDYLNSVKEYYDEKMMQEEMTGGVIAAGGVGEGVAEGVTPASTSKVLRLIQRHRPEWFDTYGIGEVEDTVVDLADMGQFSGMSATDALELVGQELESLYGQQGVAEDVDPVKDVAAIRGAIARMERELEDPNPNLDREAIKKRIAWEKRRLNLYRDVTDKEQGVAEGKDEKIAQLKKDYKTAMHWSENARSPQEREEYRRKALKIKNHLEKQYKQGVAEGHDAESIRERIAALQRDLKAVTGSYPGDGRNRDLIRRQILDLKEKLKAARSKKQGVAEGQLDEKAVSKPQQKFFGMAHAMQKGAKIPGASKELKNVAKTMKKGDVKDFAKTKHKGLPQHVSKKD